MRGWKDGMNVYTMRVYSSEEERNGRVYVSVIVIVISEDKEILSIERDTFTYPSHTHTLIEMYL